MMSAENTSFSEHEVCPVTQLPIRRRPEWTDIPYSQDFLVSYSILGNNIILSQPTGTATAEDLKDSFLYCAEVLFNFLPDRTRTVHIEDYSQLAEIEREGRRNFINLIKEQVQCDYLIFCNISSLLEMNLALGKSMNLLKDNVHLTSNYAEAVTLAVQLSSGQTEEEPAPPPKVETFDPDFDMAQGICRVSGLPVTAKPEWTNIDLGEGYSVTFKFIGDRILLSIPQGNSGQQGMKHLFQERAKVLQTMLPEEEPFFELKDYSKLVGSPTRAGREQFAQGLRVDQDRIIGFIGYNAPLAAKLAINVGQKIYRSPFPMMIVKDYATAVQQALTILNEKGLGVDQETIAVYSPRDWSIEIEQLKARTEILDKSILHTVLKGYLKRDHLEHLAQLCQKALSSASLDKKTYSVVCSMKGIYDFERQVSKQFLYILKKMYEQAPFQVFVLYGAKTFLTSTSIRRYFLPFKVYSVNNFEEAVNIITLNKLKRRENTLPRLDSQFSDQELYTSDQIQQYIEDLLTCVAGLNWDIEDSEMLPDNIIEAHPFRAVFEALNLVKLECDELHREYQRLKKAQPQKQSPADPKSPQ